jgi:type IV pilus assembly protein PilQ
MNYRIFWITILIGISVLFSQLRFLAQPLAQYYGRRITLDFVDADLRNILKLIAEVSELNIVAGDDVKGMITIKLIDVHWDQALEVILQSQSLGMVRIGNVIRIAPLERLRREKEDELASKRAVEKIGDLRTEMIHLKYANARNMVPVVKQFLSEHGTVSADERTNTLIIRDISKNIEEIRDLFR